MIDLPKNIGIGGAVRTGFLFGLAHAYDLAVQVDADGQHKPAEIRKIEGPVLVGEADMVIGSRFIEKAGFRGSLYRRAGIRMFQGINALLLGERITDSTSGFRAYGRRALEVFEPDIPRRLSRARGRLYSEKKRPADRRGPGRDGEPGGGEIVDHVLAFPLLHGQGLPGYLRPPFAKGGVRENPMENVQTFRIQILAIAGSLALIVFIIELIRRKRLREEFSILWLAMGLVFLALSIFRGWLDTFSYFVGIISPPPPPCS